MDDFLPQVGEFGLYQKRMLWLVCLPACFPCGFCAFNQLFMADVPGHWCNVPDLTNFSANERKNLAIPKENNTYNSCERYAVNWTEFLLERNGNVEVFVDESWPRENCRQGWEYNTSEVISSIAIDVCCADVAN